MEPTFFRTPAEFRAWLEEHHETETELLVGFYKKGSGRQGITWHEAVGEALCFGWIDGIGRRIDDDRRSIRFTPRKPRSTWSNVNIRRVGELTERGLMAPAGLAAFERRSESRSGIYAYEQSHEAELEREQERAFRANAEAWSFFESQPPGYRRTAIHWVVSAKREETRARRLATLIGDSASGRRLRHLSRP
jgi:uncharacterized protein YdeI (YjbR/CyaY-like superfamily)